MTPRRLLLVGAGRAHLHVLRELARRPIADVEIVVVASQPYHHRVMLAGYLEGRYDADALRIPLASLAARAHARVIEADAERADVAQGVVVANGESLPFDVCSFDVECESGASDIPGMREHALSLHPAANITRLRARVDELFATGGPAAIVVVGGGTEGVETALALRHRMLTSKTQGSVTLVEGRAEVLPEHEPPMRALAFQVLRQREVSVALGGRVTAVAASGVTLDNGATIPADLVVWAANRSAPSLFRRSGLPTDARGRLTVDRTLRAADGSAVFGAGDCVSVKDLPDLRLAGSNATRMARTLERSLRSALGKGRAGKFRPRRTSFTLLDAGGGKALLRWRGTHRHSRWAGRLKTMIDRRFMRRNRASDEKSRSRS
ncbi:MAG TPA: FAD-dependent oxidoreductase [Gemmatimonadaceae bacterium]|nr:FAD-dependent oxidoreductase [Gemmatimonadaceae bacterium]